MAFEGDFEEESTGDLEIYSTSNLALKSVCCALDGDCR